MSTYDYERCYRAGKSNGNADVLRLLQWPDRPDSVPIPGEVVYMMQHMNNTTSTSVAGIRNHTRRDPILSEVLCYMNSSWPSTCISTALTPYYKRHHERSVESDCILCGSRVLIPTSLCKSVMSGIRV